MRSVYAGILTLFLGVLLLVPRPCASAGDDDEFQLVVEPNLVQIGSFFAGEVLKVSAQVPPGVEAILEVRGKERTEKLMRKGRRGGLWMNVGEVEVKGAPCLFMAMTTPGLASSRGPQAEWGYRALEKEVEFTGETGSMSKSRLFSDFVKMKEHGGFYHEGPGTLHLSGSGQKRLLQGEIRVPSAVATGRYWVKLFLFEGGKRIERRETFFDVQMMGFPHLLYSLAFHHSVLYGVLAVVVAILVGLVMGLVFRTRSAH